MTAVIIDKKKGGRTAYVASKWPDEVLERVDRARAKTYLTRSSFVLKTIVEHLNEVEEREEKEREEARRGGNKKA